MTASYMDYCMPRADGLPSFTRRHDRDALPVQPARHQGLRRGRRHRLAAGRHQRDHRRARPRGHRHAGDARRRSGSAAQKRHDEARRGMIRRRRVRRRAPLLRRNRHVRISNITGPTSVADAVAALGDEDAKLLAGGQTLLPTMKQRLAAPTVLVDLAQDRRPLRHHARGRRHRHRRDDPPRRRRREPGRRTRRSRRSPSSPALIGDPAVRHRGTIGGSLANNDPAADYPAAALALGRDDRHQQARDRGRRLFQGPVRDGAGGRTRSSRR